MNGERIIVVGAGVGGLATALDLAARGFRVTLLERAATPGGKMREVSIGNAAIDAGPTVFTMRWVFDALFDHLGTSLEAQLNLQPVEILARHAWSESERLDLFSDLGRTAAAIGDFAGAGEARNFLHFSRHARDVYRTLEQTFICAPRPGPLDLVRAGGLSGLADLWRIKPFNRLWQTLGGYFRDPRLQQLFGRYATYCGSSPFVAPATLMLVAHVEQEGVWLVRGGMHRLAQVMTRLAEAHGVDIRFQAEVDDISVSHGRVDGVTTSNGERYAADAVVLNADPAALAAGYFGQAVQRAVRPTPRALRSLSAVTWNLFAETRGFPLQRHNVFFSADYTDEFDTILRRRRLPAAPTVYVCAQDRDAAMNPSQRGPERLLCLVNAPPDGDIRAFGADELAACEAAAFALLERCGLDVERRPEATRITTPTDFEALFPGTGGALYGQASHGWRASFSRPGSRSRVPGLYLAGGSGHPGPGVPMAAMSGRLAAAAVASDLARSGRRSRLGPLAVTPAGPPIPRPRIHPERK